jgi:multimeric flavodoxin WrbA
MKVVAINGSPHKDGNTAAALEVMAGILKEEGVDTEILQAGGRITRGCIGCGYCRTSENNECVFKDDAVNDFSVKMRAADGIILAAPTYYAGIPGDMKSFLDRTFYSGSSYFKYKVGTAVAVVRRAGGVDVVHQLMNYFNLAETVTPPSQYWTVAYGRDKREVLRDYEGMQTLGKNARAMAWLIKVIAASKDTIPAPDAVKREERIFTNFIR